MCGTEAFGGTWCGILGGLIPSGNGANFPDNSGGGGAVPAVPFPVGPGVIVNDKGVPIQVGPDGQAIIIGPDVDVPAVAADVTAFGVVRDSFWPRSVLTWLILTVIFLLISIQFVSPTRRWRLRRRRTPSPSPEAT